MGSGGGGPGTDTGRPARSGPLAGALPSSQLSVWSLSPATLSPLRTVSSHKRSEARVHGTRPTVQGCRSVRDAHPRVLSLLATTQTERLGWGLEGAAPGVTHSGVLRARAGNETIKEASAWPPGPPTTAFHVGRQGGGLGAWGKEAHCPDPWEFGSRLPDNPLKRCW